jgi:hypothetical protein
VMINDMSQDLDTTVQGIQVAITIFLLVMAALMIPEASSPTAMAASACSPSAWSSMASGRC